ncbi:uncharacterized protein LOC125042735 [Penaeus chinensis]|uniref:uncharacterized protein LOC125042735 n=1 Tax=Penaeus chinensis TaxID=139456 RepID=UPI001FB6DE1E|nr:uncharacterized protein LOC125042735 [Penaeus chinensis]
MSGSRRKQLSLLLFTFLLGFPGALGTSLEVMEEEEIKQLLVDEKYVVILFSDTPECTGKCKDLEDTLIAVREDIVESLNAWVVRTHSPALAKQYGLTAVVEENPKIEPGIIFVRSGIPMLYNGPADDDEFLLHMFVSNLDSVVKSLGDSTFEHETQASTGATTGDWLVMFTRAGCERCTYLRATVEAVAASMRNRKNVAIVDRDTDGGQTTRRFGVKDFPSLILFRLGRLYRYDLPILDAKTLEAFMTDGFRNARGEEIPHPKTPFDDFTEQCADWLRENPSIVNAVLFAGAGLILLVFVAAATFMKSSVSKKESKKKK